VRVFHWLMVASFAGAWLTAESERLRLVHVTLGYTMAALVAFRIVWGLFGTRHARFADFVRGPRAVGQYLRSLMQRNPQHHAGHNPAGAWAILGLLALTAVTTLAGWANYNEIGGDLVEELHEGAANTMMALVLVHLAGVVVSSFLHRENLVRAMLTGRKAGTADEGIARPRAAVAALLFAAVLGFWAWQWTQAPPAGGDAVAGVSTGHASAREHPSGHDDDD
jgi:cytochrome b